MSPLRRHQLNPGNQVGTAPSAAPTGKFAMAKPGERSAQRDSQATSADAGGAGEAGGEIVQPTGPVVANSPTKDPGGPTQQAAPVQSDHKSPSDPRPPSVPSTKTSSVWMTAAFAVLLLAAVIVFVTQNPQPIVVKFLGAKGHLSLAVALLGAAVSGAATVLLIGAARILQLRRLSHRRGKALKTKRSTRNHKAG